MARQDPQEQITQAMVDAGVWAFENAIGVVSAFAIVAEVYIAMEAARVQSPEPPASLEHQCLAPSVL